MIHIIAAILAAQLSAPYACPRDDWCTVYANPHHAIDIIRNPVTGAILYSHWSPAEWRIGK